MSLRVKGILITGKVYFYDQPNIVISENDRNSKPADFGTSAHKPETRITKQCRINGTRGWVEESLYMLFVSAYIYIYIYTCIYMYEVYMYIYIYIQI